MEGTYRAALHTLGGQRYRKLPRELRALMHVHAKRDEYVGAVAEDVYRMLEGIGRDDLASRLDEALAHIIEDEVKKRRQRHPGEERDVISAEDARWIITFREPSGFVRVAWGLA